MGRSAVQISAYEQRLFGRAVNDDTRPPAPNVITLAMQALGDNYEVESKGSYAVWEDGRWLRHLNVHDFIRAANRRLKQQGKPQITVNPNWRQ
jgi:hypothetical protein